MDVKRRQVGLALVLAASITFGLLAVAFHSHGFSSTEPECTFCTLVHASPAPTVVCLGSHVPWIEQRLGPPGTVALPDEPALRSHASRAPPAPRRLDT